MWSANDGVHLKTILAVFPDLSKVSLGLEISLIWTFFAGNLPWPIIDGPHCMFARAEIVLFVKI